MQKEKYELLHRWHQTLHKLHRDSEVISHATRDAGWGTKTCEGACTDIPALSDAQSVEAFHVVFGQLCLLYTDNISLEIPQHAGETAYSSVQHRPEPIDVPSQYTQGIGGGRRRACHALKH